MADALSIVNLRGGHNDADPPWMLADDQCTIAQNVEYFLSSCGERRLGCGPLDLGASTLATQTISLYIGQWFTSNDVLAPEFIAVAATPGTSVVGSARTAGVWADLSFTDAPVNTNPAVYKWQTVALDTTLFLAYVSGQDRLHAKDAGNLTIRRTGLAAPAAAPTGANSGGGGTYATVRYYRVRYTVQVAGTTVRRSEPSAVLTFTPDGAHVSVTVTKPATISEGETHWELEASPDNANFYRIATTVVGTGTYVDTAIVTTYASTGILSETIGNYNLLPAARYLIVDDDRLIGLSHCTDSVRQSQMWWTPVSADPGVGNDERLPLSVNNTKNLDGSDGGPITGGATTVAGTVYIFKWKAIYRGVRTGDVTNAYNVICISKSTGAIPDSIVSGVDESGAACIYFLDPALGPCREGQGGVQRIWGVQTTWKMINLQAGSKIACGCYYADKQQVRWAFATNGASRPNYGLTVQVNELQARDSFAVWRGLSVWTGHITESVCMNTLTELVNINGFDQVSNRPFVCLVFPDGFQRCDTLAQDAGVAYVAKMRTKPISILGLLQKWGTLNAAIMATANAGTSLVVRLIRDFDTVDTGFTKAVSTSLSPAGSETYVINELDDLVISELHALQLEFADV